MKRLSWFVLFSFAAISCLDQPDCYQLNNNTAVFGFKIIGGSTDYATVNTVTAEGTALQPRDTSITELGIFLNPYENGIDFALEGYFGINGLFGISETKKISLDYKALVQFVSEDCGERHVFSDLHAISSDFDSIRVLNTVPTRPASLNFDLYRCPVTNIINIDFVNDLPLHTITILPDSLPVPVDTTLSNILLPLVLENPDSLNARTTYLFTYTDGQEQDTLSVTYQTRHRVISPVCGRQIFIENIGYDSKYKSFTTVTVKDKVINDLPSKVNLEITR